MYTISDSQNVFKSILASKQLRTSGPGILVLQDIAILQDGSNSFEINICVPSSHDPFDSRFLAIAGKNFGGAYREEALSMFRKNNFSLP